MVHKTLRTAFFHNECAPYRMPLFQRISESPNVDLTLYFGRYTSSVRKWKANLNVSFRYEILSEIRGLGIILSNPVNPSLFFKLISNKFDVYIGGVARYVGTIVTFLAAKISRKPFILFLEDVDYSVSPYKSRLGGFLNLPFNRKLIELVSFIIRSSFSRIILKRSDAYIVPGIAAKEYLLRRNVATPKIFIAVNAVDNEFFEKECRNLKRNKVPEKLKRKLGLTGEKIILFVGYLRKEKGVQYLIRAYSEIKRHHPNVRLIVVGSGPYEEELKRISKESSVDVLFVGHQHGLDLISYYLIADVFVLPTLHDVWGFVINEAMACGCPVITTKNAGASRDLIKDDVNGYVIDPGSILHLCSALKKIIGQPEKASHMRKASRKIIKDYRYEKSVQGFKSAISYVTSLVVE